MKPQETILFFDTEFTGLNKQADLISLGIVTGDGKHFYAEMNDFDKSKCTSFVSQEVLPKLRFYDKVANNVFLKTDPYDFNVLGDKKLVKRSLLEWLNKLPKGDKIFVGDVVMWDWILLHDLMAEDVDGMPQLPKGVSYIPTDLATILRNKGVNPDVDRQQYCGRQLTKLHNALEDAKLTMWCWYKLFPKQ
jgi:hypothetical protein